MKYFLPSPKALAGIAIGLSGLLLAATLSPLAHAIGFSGMPDDTGVAAEPAPTPASTSFWQWEGNGLGQLLRRYREIAAKGGWPKWVAGKKLHPGDSDPRMPVLRQMLAVTSDYPGGGMASASLQYDNALVQAVRHFQLRHGLNQDGNLGRMTQAALAVPVETRIAQIAATLKQLKERLQQQQGKEDTGKYILVNIPAYRLFAVAGGKPLFSMRVVVGKPEDATPLFDNAITDVVFNPNWHVPKSIARKELIPKLHDDPSYFAREGFVVMVDGRPVSPAAAAYLDSASLSFRQLPGDDNALGKIKFSIPDQEDIYLHSTSAPQLFKKDIRALSHGCVRVEEPLQLAYFVMEGTPGWDKAGIDSAYRGDVRRTVKIAPVPVHLVYWTAFANGSETAYFYDDVYHKNKEGPAGSAADVPATSP